MDRRRYLPSPDGLEGRQLLSLFGGKTPATNPTTAIAQLPESFKQKELRIAHLPYFIEQLQPGRFLPSATVANIQANLQEVAGRLHAPTAAQADTFNNDLKRPFDQQNISATNAKILNHDFSVVVAGAGATPTQVAALGNDMNQLVQVDSKSIEGSRLAANDYALVMQTVLAVGRPILTPTAPTLAAKDGTRVDNNRGGYTNNQHPTLVGTYTEGATPNGTTLMQIVDANGKVYGSASVDNNGKYTVPLTVPLAFGKHRLYSRAVEPAGLLSNNSPVFILVVKHKPPTHVAAQTLIVQAGPHGMK